MDLLLFETHPERGQIWHRFLSEHGVNSTLCQDENDAIDALTQRHFDILVVNVDSDNSRLFSLFDLASYRNPQVGIITVTSNQFFSNGSIYNLIPNLRSCVGEHISSSDLCALVQHIDASSQRDHGAQSNPILG